MNQHSETQAAATDDQSVYEWVSDTARNNPLLIAGGAVALGAMVALALTRPKASQSGIRAFERRIRRQMTDAEKALKRSARSSHIANGLAELPAAVASRLSTWDTAQLDALKTRAEDLVERLTTRASSLMK